MLSADKSTFSCPLKPNRQAHTLNPNFVAKKLSLSPGTMYASAQALQVASDFCLVNSINKPTFFCIN
jgi:hypothetical protein